MKKARLLILISALMMSLNSWAILPKNCFSITASANSKVAFCAENTLVYSTDNGISWKDLSTTLVSLAPDQTIYVKARQAQTNIGLGMFYMTGDLSVSGDIMTLLNENPSKAQMGEFAFSGLFADCEGLTSAEQLKLPAIGLSSYCFMNMFGNCQNLTSAPELPATILADNCYNAMFKSCKRLNHIKCLARETSESCFKGWLENVAPTGILECSNSVEWEKNSINGIPEGWNATTEIALKSHVSESGKSHNLAGQEVDGSYDGVIVTEGTKVLK